MRTVVVLVFVFAAAIPAAAQSAAAPRNAEGVAFGLWAGPGLDGADPWFYTGIRLSFPVNRKVSADLESASLLGAESAFARFHGWYGARLRFLKTPERATSRYWTIGLGAMPGDKLNPDDGTIRERRTYAVLIAGLGARRIVGRFTRLTADLEFHGGSGIGGVATAGIQWGIHRR